MILVVGGTGSLGGSIARKLLERGKSVRVLARPQSESAAIEALGAEVVFGDLKDPASLPATLRGVRQVVCTATATQRSGPDTIETVDRHGVGHLIGAAAHAGVRRFVYISAVGSDATSPVPLFRAKGENEARLKASGLTYTILVPVLFMEVWIGAVLGSQLERGPKLQIIGEGRKKVSFISLEDVAEVAVLALDRTEAENAVLVLSAESLGYQEVIARLERTFGMPIEIEHLAPGQVLERVPRHMQQEASGLMAALAAGPEMDIATPEVASAFGIAFSSVESYLRRAFGSKVSLA